MEMLVVARILSRPEPNKSSFGYYVSKSWCRTALKWLDVQAEERKQREQRRIDAAAAAAAAQATDSPDKKGKYKPKQKKKSKKQERKNKKLSAKLSKTPPPPLNVNDDITCEHGFLKYCMPTTSNSGSGDNNVGGGQRVSRAKRRLLDKQAWKVLKILYPQGAQLSSLDGECVQCAMEVEMAKKNAEMEKLKATEERKKPLGCPLVRSFYCRRTGVPKDSLVFPPQQPNESSPSMLEKKCPPSLRNGSICPLVPGVYNVLPRAWCHRWRKYIKSGEGGKPPSPDTSACLCDGHRLPLVPPHLKAFLVGETESLMDTSAAIRGRGGENAESELNNSIPSSPNSASTLPVGFSPLSRQLGVGSGTRTPNGPRERIINGERTQAPMNPLTRSASASLSSSNAQFRSRQHDGNISSDIRASGVPESEIQLQRLAMLRIDEERALQRQQVEAAARRSRIQRQVSNSDNPMSPEDIRLSVNAQLDIENNVVVEILKDEELESLEKWWPGIHSSYALKFAVVELDAGFMDIIWTTPPCTSCDATGRSSEYDFAVRNRNRSWVNNTPKKRFGK